jgi:hypothetical protein
MIRILRCCGGLTCALVLVATLVPGTAAGQRAAYYVLDGFGGVHAGGGAPAISAQTPYFGFDVAQDIAYVPYGAGATFGNGVLVLDGFGGVHAGGALPGTQANPRTPYFGFNVARAITYRNVPPRAAGSTGTGFVQVNQVSATFTTVSSATLVAPDDGFLLVTATANVNCGSATTSNLWGKFSLNVDSTAGLFDIDYDVFLPACNHSSIADTVAITRLFPVAAGAHTVHLLARKVSASGLANLRVNRSSVTVLYVDLDGVGSS